MKSPFIRSEGSLRRRARLAFADFARRDELFVIRPSTGRPFVFSTAEAMPAVDLRSARYSILEKSKNQVLLAQEPISQGFFTGLHLLLCATVTIRDAERYLSAEEALVIELYKAAAGLLGRLRPELESLPKLANLFPTGRGRMTTSVGNESFSQISGTIEVANVTLLVSAAQGELGTEAEAQLRATSRRQSLRDLDDVRFALGGPIVASARSRIYGRKADSGPDNDDVDYAKRSIANGAFADNTTPTLPSKKRDSADDDRFYSMAFYSPPPPEVLCSIFATPSVPVNKTFPIHVYLHDRSDLTQAAVEVLKRDPSARRRAFDTLRTELEPGQEVTYFLDSQDLEIERPFQTTIWDGSPNSTVFNGNVPASTHSRTVSGKLFISTDRIPIGEIGFEIAVQLEDQPKATTQTVSTFAALPPLPEPVSTGVKKYSKAFLSYSRKDVALASLFAEGVTSNGMKLFVDVTAMEPGDEWEAAIHNAIESSDVFFLLWSPNAAASKWVEKECAAACQQWEKSHRAKPAIKPIVLKDGAPKPPFCIGTFHCDSRWRHMRIAGESRMFGSGEG